MIIVLPWPDKRLSPNARLHWRAKVGPKQAAKIKAGWLTAGTKGFHETRAALAKHGDLIPIEMRFYPPDHRHRDDDNMIGSMKAARDAIAEALGVDDRRFRPHYFFEKPEKPGRVEVVIPTSVPTPKSYVGLPRGLEGPRTKTAQARAANTMPGPDHIRKGTAI